jgi:hypothetical protein
MRPSALHAESDSEWNNAPSRIMDRVDELVQLLLLVLRKRPRLLVPARKVYVHIRGHGEVWWRWRSSCARAAGDSREAGLSGAGR